MKQQGKSQKEITQELIKERKRIEEEKKQ